MTTPFAPSSNASNASPVPVSPNTRAGIRNHLETRNSANLNNATSNVVIESPITPQNSESDDHTDTTLQHSSHITRNHVHWPPQADQSMSLASEYGNTWGHPIKKETSRWKRVILITGGAGFIGSHMVMRLVRNYPQYKIVNMDKIEYCSCLRNLKSIQHAPNYTFVKGSITSADLVTYLLKKERVDTIMHFAAQTHVDNSFGNSLQFSLNNIIGTHVLLEAARTVGIKKFIHVSTDEVYGDGSKPELHHESTTLAPTNPYAATKAGAEHMVKAYHKSFGLPVIITRGNNVYGPHQYPEKIVPKFILQAMHGFKLTLHGSGTNTRNYLYVDDVVSAFDIILHKGKIGEVYNIGGQNEISNVEVAKGILREFFPAKMETEMESTLEKHIQWVHDRPFNDLRYPLDCDQLTALGWVEKISWQDGLRRTIEWYKQYHTNWPDWRDALVAHPRRGVLQSELAGAVSSMAFDDDMIYAVEMDTNPEQIV